MYIDEDELPLFNNARGAATMQSRPPFDFDSVTMRTFPLRANISTLREFCDDYLNIMPPEIAYFRPAVPYVFLGFLFYGRMQSEVWTDGWVPQREMTFAVPLEWYRRINGRLQFQNWASFVPYIYVDDFRSQVTGREVYGWPKLYATVAPDVHVWSEDPRAWAKLVSVSTLPVDRLPPLRQEARKATATMLEVLRAPRLDVLEFPPVLHNPLNPFNLAKSTFDTKRLLLRFYETLGGHPARGYAPRQPEWTGPMLQQLMESLADLSFKTINLKQFRDAVHPRRAAYQALVSAEMRLQRLNRCGFFCDENRLAGDPSGGFKIRIFRETAAPVLDGLGLIPDATTGEDEEAIHTFEPTMPFWVDVDIGYGEAKKICWRRNASPDAAAPIPQWHVRTRSGGTKVFPTLPNDYGFYNKARADPFEALGGPLRYLVNAVRVLPLLADQTRLDKFVHEYLNQGNDGLPYRAWGRFVFLIVSDYDGVVSEDDGDIGGWVHRELSFAVPVERVGVHNVVERGFVFPYMYVDCNQHAIRVRETRGLVASRAILRSPRNSWAEQFQPWEMNGSTDELRRAELIELRTDVYPSLHPGQKQSNERLITICQLSKPPPAGEYSQPFRKGIRKFIDDSREARKKPEFGRLLQRGRQFLCGRFPLTHYSLKQFRDCEETDRAAYSALVRANLGFSERDDHAPHSYEPFLAGYPFAKWNGQPWVLEEKSSNGQLDSNRSLGRTPQLEVAIHQYPTEPIVKTLGLVPYRTEYSGNRTIQLFLAWNPMVVTSDLETRTVLEEPWTGPGCGPVYFDPGNVEPQTILDALLVKGPYADPGENREVKLGETVTLDGSSSIGELSGDLDYDWQVSDPNSVDQKVDDRTAAKTTFDPTMSGPYRCRLTVTEIATQKSHSSEITVVVVARQDGDPRRALF